MPTNFTIKGRTETGWEALYPKTSIAQVENLQTTLDLIEAAAKGATVARVFDTVAALDTWIGVTANKAKLNIGDVFLIKVKDVPDYWWDGTAKQELETSKVTLVNASANADGLMSKEDKTKLAALSNYTHPDTSGNKHIPPGGASGQILRYSADGTAEWGAENNTTYAVVTASANGLMSKEDKARLDALPTVTAGATAPTTPKTGDLWYDYNNN